MFQHTVDRAALIGPLERAVVVVDRTHAIDATTQLVGRQQARLLLQPSNRGTVAGILLPLAYIRASNPEATVAICPCDHFVYPETKFSAAVRRAAEMADLLPDRLILLGVVPEDPETDYGWIRPSGSLEQAEGWLRAVDSFVEKPGPAGARTALAQGALWNTLIMVAKVKAIWDLARQYVPEVFSLFAVLNGEIGNRLENSVLESIYSMMPDRDFSSSVLQRATERLAVASLDRIHWSDWGKPERIVATLQKIGKMPAFPMECMPATYPVADDVFASTV